MNELLLRYRGNEPIEDIVTEALKVEERELLTAILRTKSHLSRFEEKYRVPTSEFVSAAPDSFKIEDMDSIEWSGEYETLQRIEKRLKRLREIEVCA